MRMPVDLFPPINIPVVVVATFYSGMPPEQIENDITGRFERFFTLGSGIDHIESRSLPGVSLIKVYFQPGHQRRYRRSAPSPISPMADLRRLPPGTLPPVVLKFDASSLPVCLITLKGEGLNETQLRDLGQFNVRNQIASVPGASVPQPFGGQYRQIMVYVDPLKLEAHQLSVMDVVRTVNDSNLILPAGDVKIGPLRLQPLHQQPAAATSRRSTGCRSRPWATPRCWSRTSATPRTAHQIQTNIVRVDGQTSVYLPVLKQGGDANTIAVVDGIKDAVAEPGGCPEGADRQGGVRPVGLRQDRHREPAARRRHRPGPHRADDPDLPRQCARDRRRCSSPSRSRRWRPSSRCRLAAVRSTP